MTRTAKALLLAVLWALPGLPLAAASGSEAAIAALEPGQWYEFPDSHLLHVMPMRLPRGNPEQLMRGYSGGAYDTTRNRLIVHGGGHAGYSGNEVYVFDVPSGRWQRLTEPSYTPLENEHSPYSVHTYDQLEYLPRQDRLFLAGGSIWKSGRAVRDTWLFDFGSDSWTRVADIVGRRSDVWEYNMTTAYDPLTDRLLMTGYHASADYHPASDTWTHHNNTMNRRLGQTGAFDPVRRKFVTIGRGRAFVYDVDASGRLGDQQPLETTGANEIEQPDAPGFEYDPVSDRFVAWAAGPAVYVLDLDSRSWQRLAATNSVDPGDPYAKNNYRGTFGRFRYMPDYNAFIVAWDIARNVYAYKLASAPGEAQARTEAPTVPDSYSLVTNKEATPRFEPTPAPTRTPALTATATAAPAPQPPAAASALETTADATCSEADWRARSTAPEVIYSNNFDTRADWLDNVFDRRSCQARYAPGCRANAWDTKVKASGGGSVRFDVLSNTGQAAVGNVVMNFAPDPADQIGANDEVWIQWRQRFDPFVIEHKYKHKKGNAGWKQVILAQGNMPRLGVTGQACSEGQIVVVNAGQRGYASSYIECKAYEPFDTHLGGGRLTRQNLGVDSKAASGCHYWPMDADKSRCLFYRPDQWMTFMMHLKTGSQGSAKSSVSKKPSKRGLVGSLYELYIGYEGEPMVLAHRQENLVIPRGQRWTEGEGYKGGWKSSNAHPEERFVKLWLTPFNTKKDPTESHEDASIWYDEVIVSRSRIADPGSFAGCGEAATGPAK